jgi:hypothetical protein
LEFLAILSGWDSSSHPPDQLLLVLLSKTLRKIRSYICVRMLGESGALVKKCIWSAALTQWCEQNCSHIRALLHRQTGPFFFGVRSRRMRMAHRI